MKTAGYVALAIATSITLLLVKVLRPNSIQAAAFISAWLLVPYAILAVILTIGGRDRASTVANAAAALLISVAGLLFLVRIMFVWPDPQGAIAVFLTPAYQILGMAVLVPLCHWLARPRAG